MADTQVKLRKILDVGDSYLITLPPEWVKRNGLKYGDRVALVWDRNLVVMIPPRIPEDWTPYDLAQLSQKLDSNQGG